MLKPIAPRAEQTRLQVDQQAAAIGAGLTVYETTVTEPGTSQARAALAAGADLVIAAGGDGTVRAVAAGMVGSRVPLGIIGLGTANLLAGNLGLPTKLATQVATAMLGDTRRIDVGLAAWQSPAETDLDQDAGLPHDAPVPGTGPITDTHPCQTSGPGQGWSADQVFLVMAGIGHDAATVGSAGRATKQRLGWLAYLWVGARRLASRPIPMTISVDEGPRIRTRAWSVLVGNCGRLPGGVEVFPGARIDDGELDVLRAEIANPAQWLPVAASGLTGRSVPGAGLQRRRARTVLVTPAEPTAVHLDGDVFGPVSAIRFGIVAGALSVRVPRVAAH